MELSLPGAKVPWNFRSQERKFNGTFAPGNESFRERNIPGTFIPESESSMELSIPKGKKLELTLVIVSNRKCNDFFSFSSIDLGIV